ncbi:hypothetical protein NX779_02990 [Mycoplasma cottewii]|uniref:Uncharacterized protein n=1 Tax=Mycoplasma cottewii TaxID=51364 RepID=A0ABY5TXM3_9MOLU|nr:hypothetical protein [Mycoplasma cottewii]UWD34756.1 hypothetical protein NX779_02990 [Mycoplasma cottewii]
MENFNRTISNSIEDDFGMELEEKVAKKTATRNKKNDPARDFINKTSISKNVQIEQDLFSNKPVAVKYKIKTIYMNERVLELHQKLVNDYVQKRGKAPSLTDIFIEGLYSLQNKIDNEQGFIYGK